MKVDQGVTREINEIAKCLNSDNFFNISGLPINAEIAAKLKLDRKHNPFCKLKFKTELRQFDGEVVKIIWRLWKNFTPVRNNTSVPELFNFFKKSANFKSDPKYKKLWYSLRRSYFSMRPAFIHSMKLRLTGQPQLHGVQNYDAMFDLGPDLIIVEADKNLGYVCLTTHDLVKQYELINLKQHFGKSKIKETWYIIMICKFIKKAAQFIPSELSKVIPLSCLYWAMGSGEIGVLRLM